MVLTGLSAPEDLAHAVCLGCGCACDDIGLVIQGARIVDVRRACPRGVAWYGDGGTPGRVCLDGVEADLDQACARAAALLVAASRPLIYLAPGVSCEAQREAVGLADVLRAAVDSVSSATARDLLLAAQERGVATATLGEIRHRADLVVFWGTDPDQQAPRYRERYVPDCRGLDGRPRKVLAVDIGDRRGPSCADARLAITAGDEVALLTWLTAAVLRDDGPGDGAGRLAAVAAPLAAACGAAGYVVLVVDAESPLDAPADPVRSSALIAFAQALNRRSRAALSLLRSGGNRSGADAVLTAQTGYPFAVDFATGAPAYRPHAGTAHARLERGAIDLVLVVGAVDDLPVRLAERLSRVPHAVIGPRATAGVLGRGAVAIDTGVLGVHDRGLALRTDDVPLDVRGPLKGPPSAAACVRHVRARVGATAIRVHPQ